MILILVTLGILTLGLSIGLVYNYLLMYTSVFEKLKIRKQQLEQPLSISEFKKRIPLILVNLASLYILSFFGLWLGQGLFNMEWTGVGLFVLHFLVILFADDLMFYIVHRTLHENKFLNQKVHNIHHQATQPFPMDFIYAHPIEWLSGYAGAFVGVISLYFISQFDGVNVYAFWAWGMFRSLHELDIHSGVRSSIGRFIPLMANAEHHDMHHLRSKGNYASTLILWDWVFGTWIRKSKEKV